MIIEKAKIVYDEMRAKCTFSDGGLQIVWEHHGIRRLGISGHI